MVVGDCMLDHWLWGAVHRISPEAPVPVVEIERSTCTAGGAANVVHNLCRLGASTAIVGVVGQDDAGRQLRNMLSEEGANVDGLVALETRPTTTKMRIIAHSQQVVRADTECRHALGESDVNRILAALGDNLGGCKALLFSDYAKGVLTPPVIEPLLAEAHRLGVRIVAQPKPANISWYADVDVLAVNEAEARGATGIACDTEAGTEQAARVLSERLHPRAVLITRGHRGMSLVQDGRPAHHVPALARQVYDVSGAGDTVVSVLTLSILAGATMEEATRLANLAAAVVVQKVGTATVEVQEIVDAMRSLTHPEGQA